MKIKHWLGYYVVLGAVFVICQILCLHFLQSQIKVQAISTPEEQLFSYSVEDKSEEEISEVIQSSSNGVQMLMGLMDGEISKKILEFLNSEVTSGKKMEVDFMNLDVPIDNDMNVRLRIDYFQKVGDPTIMRDDTLRFRIKIENNGEESFVGPFKIIDSVPTGVYEAGSKPFWNFELISENIEFVAGDHITEIEIVPVATQPNSSSGSFCINGIELSSYADQNYDDGIEREYQNREEVRKSIARRMYDLATIKWTPKEVEGVDGIYGNNSASSNPTSRTLHYLSGTYYYGIPYGQKNATTLERFASLVENSVYNYDEEALNDIVWNEDGTIKGFRVGYGRKIETLQCATSTFEAMSAFLPFHVGISGPNSFIWNTNIERVLGGLEYSDVDLTWEEMVSNPNEPTRNTNDFVEINGEQNIYEGYAELEIGDVVSSYPVGQHVRLVTGETVVVRNSDETIDPVNSYIIATEIWGITYNYNYEIEEDQVDWVPNPKYTDINTIQDLAGNNVTWRVNKKFTFADLINQQAYVPVRMLALDSDEVEKPYFEVINANTVEDVRNGLKGTLVSNYKIDSVTYTVENLTKGTKYVSTEYPAKSTDPQIGAIRNVYSLFRRTSEDVQNAVRSIGLNDEFKITISAFTGAKEGVALVLSNAQNPDVDPEADPEDGDDDAISAPNTGKGEDKNSVENVAIVLLLVPIVLGSIVIILNKTVFRCSIGFTKKS